MILNFSIVLMNIQPFTHSKPTWDKKIAYFCTTEKPF